MDCSKQQGAINQLGIGMQPGGSNRQREDQVNVEEVAMETETT